LTIDDQGATGSIGGSQDTSQNIKVGIEEQKPQQQSKMTVVSEDTMRYSQD